MTWRNAPILDALRAEADALGARFLGTVGDLSHQQQGSRSDHNPDGRGVVHAIDLSYGDWLANWNAAQRIAAFLKANPAQAASIKYLVSNDGRKDVITSASRGWSWAQNGSVKQDHRSHVHTSVTVQGEGDTRPLLVPALRGASAPAAAAPAPDLASLGRALAAAKATTLRVGAKGDAVVWLQTLLNQRGAKLTTDGDFGSATSKAVIAFQRTRGLPADGIVGPRTWGALS